MMSAAKSIEPSTHADPHLSLVFNESGEDHLVLASWWTGCGNRPHPDLRDVKQAKPRLRALCILFLLAKSQQALNSPADNPVRFKVGIKKGTWICTLASKPSNTSDWVEEHFHFANNHLFLRLNAGSAHNRYGKEPPHVEFLPHRIPLSNLHLFVQRAGALDAQPRPLRHEETIPFALRLESLYWKQSAIKEWLSIKNHERESTSLGRGKTGKKLSEFDNDLSAACMADVLERDTNVAATEWKKHFDLMSRILLEKEFANYRESCTPFFSYLGNPLNSSKLPFLWQQKAWNVPQRQVLRHNCCHYANAFGWVLYELRTKGGHFDDPEFTKSVLGKFHYGPSHPKDGIYSRQSVPLEDVDHIFSRLIYFAGEFDYGMISFERPGPLVLDETKESVQLLEWGLKNENRSIAAGALFVLHGVLIDFLAEVCLPCLTVEKTTAKATMYDYSPVESDIGKLVEQIMILKKESVKNRNLIFRFCHTQRDFLDAAQAGRVVLRAQIGFFTALHRRLVALEN